MPRATAWPIVLALGITLLGAGLVTSLALSVVGAVLFVFGLGGWIGQLLPGRGHRHEPMVEPALRPRPVTGTAGHGRPAPPRRGGLSVPASREGPPDLRRRQGRDRGRPGDAHPGAGLRRAQRPWPLVPRSTCWRGWSCRGSAARPWLSSNNSPWRSLILAIFIHATLSVTFGLLFGVVSPTLPPIPGGPVIAGGVLMPLLWTGLCYGFMGIVNPLLQEHVNWPWFIASQVVYGLAMSIVVINSEKVPAPPVGGGPSLSVGSPESGQGGGHP